MNKLIRIHLSARLKLVNSVWGLVFSYEWNHTHWQHMTLGPSRNQWLRKFSTVWFSWSLCTANVWTAFIFNFENLLPCLSFKENSISFPGDVDPRGLWSRWHITCLVCFSGCQQPALPVVRGFTLFFMSGKKKSLETLRDSWPIKLFANNILVQTNVKIWFHSLKTTGISHFFSDNLNSKSVGPL